MLTVMPTPRSRPSAIAVLLASMRSRSRLRWPLAGLDDLEVGVDEAALPLRLAADGPNDPQLVGAAADRLHQVGIGQIDAVDIAVPVDRHGSKPHGQRHARHQQALVHLIVLDDAQLVFAEIVDIEGAETLGAIDLLPVELPALAQHPLAELVVGDEDWDQ